MAHLNFKTTMVGSVSVRNECQACKKLQLLINMTLFGGAAQKVWAQSFYGRKICREKWIYLHRGKKKVKCFCAQPDHWF